MKRLLIMSFLMLACQMLQAGPITKEKAKESAARFLHQKDGTALTRSRDMRQVNVNLTNAEESANDAFYVFNIGKAEGFVIVSNDDCTDAIFGYADKGEIIPENMPENMKAWLQGYADEIKWMRDHNISGKADAGARRRAVVKTEITPLLVTTWNQGAPYYNNCPVFVNGNRCVTGCVATAMAQVLNYHGQKSGKPEQTLATIPAYDCEINWSGYGKIHVNEIQAGEIFHWNNMKGDYSGDASDAQKTAVATLMQCCGASLCMEYRDQYNGGSSASDYNVPLALKTYFGYDADTRYVRREDYTIMDWNNLIYSELASDRPVFYGGTSTGGGHAFVVDGYDGDGYFHVNWGWGGYCDGNFRLSALDPESNSGIGASSTKDGYNMGQDAIIGAQPSTGSAVEEDNSLLLGDIESVSGTSITVKFINWSGKQNNFKCGIGYMSNGNIVLASGERTYNDFPNETSITIPNVQISNLADGTYKLFPISKVTTSSIWKTNVDVERDYVLAVVSGGNTTLTMNTLTPNLAVSAMTFSGMKYVNNTQNVEVTITNTGDEFTGYVYMFVSQTTDKGTYVNKKSIAVTKNGNTTIDMSFLPTAAGTYKVWICSDEAGTNSLGYRSVTIESVSNVNNSDFQIVACSFDGEDSSTLTIDDGGAPNQIIDVYSKNVVAHITVKNMTSGTKTYSFTFLISEYNGSNYLDVSADGGSFHTLQLSSGGTYTFDVDLGTLEYGKRYKIILQKLEIVESNNHFYIQGQSKFDDHVRFRIVSGYSTWTENGVKSVVETTEPTLTIAENVVAVDLSGYTFTNVKANSNLNTLYYLSESQTIPEGLTGRNVIKGNSATKIQLQDGSPFYVPTAFSADEITYTRRFTTAASTTSGGWSTMVIPFDVDVVKADDKTLSWFQSDDDSNKDFWLMQFSNDETDQVNFGYTNSICANYPYLIAVPGDNWGVEHQLTGKDIVFSATTTTVTSTSRSMLSGDFYTMYGTYAPKTVNSDAYVLNSVGSGFVKKSSSVTLKPFRAYFLPKYGYGSHAALSIGMTGNQATGITPLFHDTPTTANDIYNISGVKVGTVDNMQQLKPGIYIVNGKKIVKQ